MRNNQLHQNKFRCTARQNIDTVQLMVTTRHHNLHHLHVCAAAWGREKASMHNNRLHHNNIRRTAPQNTDTVQLMVSQRHPNLHVYAAALGQESAGMRNNRLRQNNIRRTAMELGANICVGRTRPSNRFLGSVDHHHHHQQQH